MSANRVVYGQEVSNRITELQNDFIAWRDGNGTFEPTVTAAGNLSNVIAALNDFINSGSLIS